MSALRESPEVLYGAASRCDLSADAASAAWPRRSASSTAGEQADEPNRSRLGGLSLFFGIFVTALASSSSRENGGCCWGRRSRQWSAPSTTSVSSRHGRKLEDSSSPPRLTPFFGVWIDHLTFPFSARRPARGVGVLVHSGSAP